MLGRGAWAGGVCAAFLQREREVRVFGMSPEDPSYRVRQGGAEASLSCGQTEAHPLGVEELEGWGEEQVENWEILELMLVKCSGVCRIGGLGGCVLGARCRERTGEGEGKQERPGSWEN